MNSTDIKITLPHSKRGRHVKTKVEQKKKYSLLAKHFEKIDNFKNKKKILGEIDKKIQSLENELSKKNKKSLEYEKLMSTLSNLKKDKEKYNDKYEIEYLQDSAMLVNEYYALKEQESTTTDQTILNQIHLKKMELTNEYLQKFENDFSYSTTFMYIDYNICKLCNVNMEIQNGFLTCLTCGHCVNCVDEDSGLSYKQMQDVDFRPAFTYLKISHLEDWLARFQSKENTVIPQEVLDKVIIECGKEKIRDLNLLTEEKVKRYLKRLGLNEYYDNVIGIINRLNNRPPFQLSTEIEDKIKMMFQQIQEPFVKHKPPTRKNFLSYSYVLHKFFQILGLNEFTKYFPLLKSDDKLRQQDDIFKKIVADMRLVDKSVNWVFYPSI